MWFVLAGLLLARKAFSTAAQVAYTVHMVFNIKTVCLHYVILEMHSFPMSGAKHFYDNPLSIYLDPKIFLICRLRPVEAKKTETNILFRIVPKLLSVPVSVVSNRN
jgi:hypothetical protein